MAHSGPAMFSDFNTNGPAGLPDPSRAVTPVAPGRMVIVGGSNPADGKSPYDINPGHYEPATMDTVWGMQTQAAHLGGQVI